MKPVLRPLSACLSGLAVATQTTSRDRPARGGTIGAVPPAAVPAPLLTGRREHRVPFAHTATPFF